MTPFNPHHDPTKQRTTPTTLFPHALLRCHMEPAYTGGLGPHSSRSLVLLLGGCSAQGSQCASGGLFPGGLREEKGTAENDVVVLCRPGRWAAGALWTGRSAVDWERCRVQDEK